MLNCFFFFTLILTILVYSAVLILLIMCIANFSKNFFNKFFFNYLNIVDENSFYSVGQHIKNMKEFLKIKDEKILKEEINEKKCLNFIFFYPNTINRELKKRIIDIFLIISFYRYRSQENLKLFFKDLIRLNVIATVLLIVFILLRKQLIKHIKPIELYISIYDGIVVFVFIFLFFGFFRLFNDKFSLQKIQEFFFELKNHKNLEIKNYEFLTVYIYQGNKLLYKTQLIELLKHFIVILNEDYEKKLSFIITLLFSIFLIVFITAYVSLKG